ncbi:MAG TPA: heme biosynthesis HemY N-terminal domain-containing protein [Alphaproteobacteria bacterium]|nr:heme biosynthesis HemY N-terminal domain-containing protein [Alphaproteobacteria bacterium]
MKGFIFILVLISALIALGFLALQDPGTVEIVWLGYEVQITALLAFLFLLFIFILIILLSAVVSWFLGIPIKWLSFFRRSQSRKAELELIELLSSYEAETFSRALQHQKKVAHYYSDNPFFLWASGNTFERADKHFDAEKCFMALTKNPSTTFLGLKGQIRSALHRGEVKSAYELLKLAEKVTPSSPWVLKHLLALTREREDFEEAETLIERLNDLGYLTSEQSKKQTAFVQYQKALQPKVPLDQKEMFLRQAHYLDPSLAEATAILAPLLYKQGHVTYALTALEATWSLNPTQVLGDLYLKFVEPKNDMNAFQEAQTLVKANPQHPESLFFLARIALQAKLWGEARAHLADLLKQKPTAEAYQLMSHLELEEKHDWKAALKWLEEGIEAPRHV